MNDKVYIVVKSSTFKYGVIIESAWTTFELAQSAVQWHAQSERISPGYFSIVVRELNKTTKMNKQYLGDGVYVEYDGYGLVLTTENGIEATNRIVLEPEVCSSLVRYVNLIKSQDYNEVAKDE